MDNRLWNLSYRIGNFERIKDIPVNLDNPNSVRRFLSEAYKIVNRTVDEKWPAQRQRFRVADRAVRKANSSKDLGSTTALVGYADKKSRRPSLLIGVDIFENGIKGFGDNIGRVVVAHNTSDSFKYAFVGGSTGLTLENFLTSEERRLERTYGLPVSVYLGEPDAI